MLRQRRQQAKVSGLQAIYIQGRNPVDYTLGPGSPAMISSFQNVTPLDFTASASSQGVIVVDICDIDRNNPHDAFGWVASRITYLRAFSIGQFLRPCSWGRCRMGKLYVRNLNETRYT
jgi:hypothetical protein